MFHWCQQPLFPDASETVHAFLSLSVISLVPILVLALYLIIMLLLSVGELPFQSRVPWTNDEILVAKENRRKAEKKKRASRTQADLLGISSESQHRVTNDILFNMNNQRLTLFLLLGLSAAFETVAYDTLKCSLSSAPVFISYPRKSSLLV